MASEPRSPASDGAGAPSGLSKVFEGDVQRAHIVHAELEGRDVPAFATEPQFYTFNPELSRDRLRSSVGIVGGAACVSVPVDRRTEALQIVEHAP